MSVVFHCPAGHEWRMPFGTATPAGWLPCPVCGAASAAGADDPPRTVTLPVGPPRRAEEPRALPRVAGYEVLGELGRGAMAVVYAARQLRPGRLVALKMLRAGAYSDLAELARFRAEAESIARLQHPNIVQVYEVGDGDGVPFFSLEYCGGGSLASRLDGTPWPARAAAELVRTLAGAMHAAHSRQIVHRDLKPANILLAGPAGAPVADCVAKISDFGLAKQLDGGAGLTASEAVLGTPSYMAPEQAGGKGRRIDRLADVYALGAILYHLVTGRPPFRAETPMDTVLQVLTEEPVPPRRLQSKVPTDLETICLKCLQKDPRRRFATAEELADDLGRYLADQPIRARPVGRAERTWRWCRRNPAAASMAAAVALLLVVLAAGASAAALLLNERRRTAEAHLARAERAEEELRGQLAQTEEARRSRTEQLGQSYLDQARALRLSGQPGQRGDASRALASAAAIARSLGQGEDIRRRLRDEAAAGMALADLRPGRALDLHPPGTFLVSCGPGLRLYARSRQNGDLTVRRLPDDREVLSVPGPGTQAYFLHFSPDGEHLAVMHHRLPHVHVWNLGRGREVFRATPRGGLVFSPDGKTAAVPLLDGGVSVHDLSTGAEVSRLKLPPEYRVLAYHPHGRQLAVSVGAPPAVRVYEVDGWRLLQTLPQPGPVSFLAWRPDGAYLATCAGEGNLQVWNVATGALQARLRGVQARVDALAYSAGGELLASTAWDGTFRLWDPLTGRQLLTGGGLGVVRPGPDSPVIAQGRSGSTCQFWEAVASRECRTVCGTPGKGGVLGVSLSSDGRLLAQLCSDGVHLWDWRRLREVAHLPRQGLLGAQFHPDDGSLLTSGGAGMHRWPIRTGPDGERRVGPAEPLRGVGVGRAGPLALGGREVAVVDFDGDRAVVLDPARPAVRATAGQHPAAKFVALSPDGRWLATGTSWGEQSPHKVQVWDTRAGRTARAFDLHEVAEDANVTFTPDGRWLVTGTIQEYRFWKTDDWSPGRVIPRDGGNGFAAMACAPEGRLLALARSGVVVQLMDSATGAEVVRLPCPDQRRIEKLAFSPDGGVLAAGCEDQVVHVWDLRRLRAGLAEMGLDWDLPPYRPEVAADAPLRVRVESAAAP